VDCNLLKDNCAAESSVGRIAVSFGAANLAAEVLELGECNGPDSGICANANREPAKDIISAAFKVLNIQKQVV
jgi:hypothetical protein